YAVPGLDAFRTQPIVDVHLWYPPRPLGFDFATLLDSPVQWVFAKGPGYLCCSLSAASATVSLSEAELVDLADAEVRAVLPALQGERRLRGAALRDPEATFTPSCGLRRPGPRPRAPHLVLAGPWTDTGWPA